MCACYVFNLDRYESAKKQTYFLVSLDYTMDMLVGNIWIVECTCGASFDVEWTIQCCGLELLNFFDISLCKISNRIQVLMHLLKFANDRYRKERGIRDSYPIRWEILFNLTRI